MKDRKLFLAERKFRSKIWDRSRRDFTLRHMLRGLEKTHMESDIICYIIVFASVWGLVAVERVIEGGFK